jgi:hypothetical protein
MDGIRCLGVAASVLSVLVYLCAHILGVEVCGGPNAWPPPSPNSLSSSLAFHLPVERTSPGGSLSASGCFPIRS